jgi:hypothetical protein
MSEDAQDTREEWGLTTITLDILVLEEADQRLRGGQSNGCGHWLSSVFSTRRIT